MWMLKEVNGDSLVVETLNWKNVITLMKRNID